MLKNLRNFPVESGRRMGTLILILKKEIFYICISLCYVVVLLKQWLFDASEFLLFPYSCDRRGFRWIADVRPKV